MNSDGTIKSQAPSAPVVKESYPTERRRRERKPVHEFNLFKRYPKCDCKNCWKNFALTTIFYVIVIYIIYLVVQYIFSKIDTQSKTLTTPELPTSL